jgi:hypothetical protein
VKLARLVRDWGVAAIASAVGISEPTLRSHRDGRTLPTERLRVRDEQLGIRAEEWSSPVDPSNAAVATVTSTPSAAPPADGLEGALAAAQAIFRSPATSPPDRLRAIGAALSAIAATERRPRPRYVAEYVEFVELAQRLDETLVPYPEERVAVAKIIEHHDALAPAAAPVPSAPLDEVVSVIDGTLSGELADRDKASAVHAKVRAARIQARLDDSAVTATD